MANDPLQQPDSVSENWPDPYGSLSGATLTAYRREWRGFCDWCRGAGADPLPASERTVVLFLQQYATLFSMSTLYRKVAAIACAHALAGARTPTDRPAVARALRDIRGAKTTQRAPKTRLMSGDLRTLVDHLPVNLLGERDRCVILLGFASGLLRSQLVRLDRDNIVDTGSELVIHAPPLGNGPASDIVIPLAGDPVVCPVLAFRAWMESSGIQEGPVFRWVTRHGQVRTDRLSDKSVALIVKRAAKAAGRDPGEYSSRSLQYRPERRSIETDQA